MTTKPVHQFTRFRVQTMNQRSSYVTFDANLSAEKIAEVLGWDPEGEAVAGVLGDLLAGESWSGHTSKVPMDKGTKYVEFHFEPIV